MDKYGDGMNGGNYDVYLEGKNVIKSNDSFADNEETLIDNCVYEY